jgi:hypothetical protein
MWVWNLSMLMNNVMSGIYMQGFSVEGPKGGKVCKIMEAHVSC